MVETGVQTHLDSFKNNGEEFFVSSMGERGEDRAVDWFSDLLGLNSKSTNHGLRSF